MFSQCSALMKCYFKGVQNDATLAPIQSVLSAPGSLLLTYSTENTAWIRNHARCFVWNTITYTCRDFNGSLTHWGRVTHICVGKLTIIGSDNGLSPGRRQAIIWTNTGVLLIGPLETNLKFQSQLKHFHSRRSIWKCRLENVGHFISASM